MKLRPFVPHISAVLIFLAVTFIAFPQLFFGKVLEQTDIKQFKSMSHEIVEFREQHKQEPLWTTTMYGGMPTTQISTYYSGNYLGVLDDAVHLWLPRPARFIFIALIGFFILMLSMKVDPWLAIVGSLAFGLSTLFFINADAGHNSKSNAIDYLPFIFAGIIWLYNDRKALGFSLTAIFLALEFNANHIQITYYGFLLFFIVIVTYLVYAIKQKKIKSFAISSALFGGAIFLGLLPNAGNLWMTYNYSKYSNRSQTALSILPDRRSNEDNRTGGVSKEYALEWSNSFSELPTLFLPNYKGGSSKPFAKTDHADLRSADKSYQSILKEIPAYFGSQPFTNGPIYVGVIVVLFAIIGAYGISHPLKVPLLIAIALALLLSLGSNYQWFTDLFFRFVPGYNKFRSIIMVLVLAQLCIPIMSVLAIEYILKLKKPNRSNEQSEYSVTSKVVRYAALGFTGFCLIAMLAPQVINNFEKKEESNRYHQIFLGKGYTEQEASLYTDELMKNVVEVRKHLVKTDALRALFLIFVAVVLLYFYDKRKIKSIHFVAGLGLLITADLLLVGNRIVNDASYISKIKSDEAPELSETDKRILTDTSYFRVVNGVVDNPFIDATTSYYHHSIGGYHAAKLGIYEDISNFSLKPEMKSFLTGIDTVKITDSLLSNYMERFPALNMINTKYFIVSDSIGSGLITNPRACGNCWLVKNLKEVASADSEILALRNFDPQSTAIIRSSNKVGNDFQSTYDGKGTINLIYHLPNKMVYRSETNSNELVVFSEIYYPDGWSATIDGVPATILNVNYVLRALQLPAGKHKIEFVYLPEAYAQGNSIARLGAIFLLCFAGLGIGMDCWHRKKINAV